MREEAMKTLKVSSLLCVISSFMYFLTPDLNAQLSTVGTNCFDEDPASLLTNVLGDFELIADPQDPAGNLIYISNVTKGLSDIIAVHLDALSGQVIDGSVTAIANNFQYPRTINGPEFVQKPTGELGVIYSGGGGVHGVFRGSTPAAWNDFSFDVDGAPTNGSPPLLPATANGAIPTATIPLGQNTYAWALGKCQQVCYGALASGISTDVNAVLAQQKQLTVSNSTQSMQDGYIFIGACATTGGACALYEGLIDNAGGFVPGTLQVLAQVGAGPVLMVAAQHPATGTTVLFSNEGQTMVDVWEQAADGSPLTLIARVPVPSQREYRAATSDTEIILNIWPAPPPGTSTQRQGAYTIAILANGSSLVVGNAKSIVTKGLAPELAWLPAANSWAEYFRSGINKLTACFVSP